jgi:hypothetical protein
MSNETGIRGVAGAEPLPQETPASRDYGTRSAASRGSIFHSEKE